MWAAVASSLVILGGAAGGAFRSDLPELPPLPPLQQDYVSPAAPDIDAATMLAEYKDFVKTYPKRQGNAPTHEGARNAIAAEFASAGLTVWRHDFFNGIAQQNVCGIKFGSVNPQIWIVVGGHMDSTTWDTLAFGSGGGPLHAASEGAYDNGAGTRLTVALAKAYAPLDAAFSILFCTFDGEERGLQGSQKVKQAMDNDLLPGGFPWAVQETRAMMNMDMFGINWPVRAPIFAEVNDNELKAQVDAVRIANGIPTTMFKFQGIALGQSDNRWWHQAGIPTVFYISDFQELGIPASNNIPPGVQVPATPNGAYPFWHHDDTWETMLVMAGGDAALEAAFQTALNVSSQTLAVLALHPEIPL